MAHELPPPAVMRSQRNMNSQRNMSAGGGETNDAFGNTDEWQPIDYWYNRVLSKSSPAANTANPSALGLIAFGYTTALLQVRSFALLPCVLFCCCLHCGYCLVGILPSETGSSAVWPLCPPWLS